MEDFDSLIDLIKLSKLEKLRLQDPDAYICEFLKEVFGENIDFEKSSDILQYFFNFKNPS